MGNGFRVEGCDFGFNRSRGILIKASDGRVVGNKLTANWGEAIKVSPEYWWQESGSSNNVEVRDNQITGCRTIALAVYAHGAQTLAPAGAHRHITVTGNRIADSPIPNILVTSTDGLRLAGNLCTPAQDARISGHYLWLFGLDAGKLEAVMTKNCLNVTRE
jgi:hypothetical protein